jgi:hypothetical protein
MKKDVDITDADIKKYHLMLVGTANNNRIIQRLSKNLPISVNGNEIRMGNETYHSKNAIVSFIYPNPLNRQKYVLLITGNSNQSWNSIPFEYWYTGFHDYYMHETAPDGKCVRLKEGYFGEDWELK